VTALAAAVASPWFFVVAGAIVGGVVQGVSGFGLGMVGMSLWIWGLDPREALVLAVFCGLCGQVLSGVTVRQTLPLKPLLPFIACGLVGVPLGAWLLPHLDASSLKRLIGTLLAVGCPLMIFAPAALRIRRGGAVLDAAAGFAGGVIGGLSGFTGLAPALWSTVRGYDKQWQRALLHRFNLVALAAVFTALVWRGVVTAEMLPHLGTAVIASIVPLFAGARLYRRLSDMQFRRIVLGLLAFAGIAILVAAR
jgi:uncharacterized membrane protein YfcA